MRPLAPRPSFDGTDLHIRRASVTAGVRVTMIVCAAAAVDVRFYAHPSHRAALAVVLAVAILGAVVFSLLPWERIVSSRWREPVFLAWSLSNVATISVFGLIDQQRNSAVSLMFIVPIVFVSMSYPLRSVLIVAAAALMAYLGVALDVGTGMDFVAMFSAVLISTAVMGAWQARNHDRVREELALMSRTDPLTGCLNRRGFEERAAAAIRAATAVAANVVVVLVDLDGFKQVNDTRGHAAGDTLLREVADCLLAAVGPADVVGRLGGDEFALLLHDAEGSFAAHTTERVRTALALVAGASTGAAAAPDDGTVLDALLSRADWRLYESKSIAAGDRVPAASRLDPPVHG